MIVYNKIDLLSAEEIKDLAMSVRAGEVLASAADGMNIQELKEKIATLKPEDTHQYPLIQDLIEPLDLVILVVPIDKAAPKGRLILPQQQTIRDILERGALSLVVRDTDDKKYPWIIFWRRVPVRNWSSQTARHLRVFQKTCRRTSP